MRQRQGAEPSASMASAAVLQSWLGADGKEVVQPTLIELTSIGMSSIGNELVLSKNLKIFKISKVLRMGLPRVESLSGLIVDFFCLSRIPQLPNLSFYHFWFSSVVSFLIKNPEANVELY